MARKQVITVDPADLITLSQRLLQTMTDDGFRPECVVGIATGGVLVAEAMRVPEEIPVYTVQLRRPSTATKNSSGIARNLANRLPYSALDLLRNIEDRRLERRVPIKSPTSSRLDSELDAVVRKILDSAHARVAVVDDAVDSGLTLARVEGGLRHRLGNSVEIRTAVLTVTRPDDRIALTPDHRLFHETLLRFPWSMDYKP